MNKERINSVCVFGSSARGSSDNLSDRDLLVISDDSIHRRQLTELWSRKNWSVASYTPTRFQKLVESGSLFVQHLRQEGQILQDAGNWLREHLAKARPKESYSVDAANSVLLAAPAERFDVDAPIAQSLLAADVSYVAVRNFGICHLADKGSLSFDYSKIVEAIGKDLNLHRSEISLLASLRKGKVAYRKGLNSLPLTGSVGELRAVLSKLFVHRPLAQVESESPIRWLGGGYPMLRDFEASVITRLGKQPSKNDIQQYGLEETWKWVRNPRTYSWSVRNLSIRDLSEGSKHVAATIAYCRSNDCADRFPIPLRGLSLPDFLSSSSSIMPCQ